MLSQNEIWEGIVHKWATSEDIIDFLAHYVDTEHYELLSNHEQLDFDIFRRLVCDDLSDKRPSRLLYDYLAYRLADYGWQLED